MTSLLSELFAHQHFLKISAENPNGISQIERKKVNDLTFTLLDSGVLCIEPDYFSSKDIVISSGIHGNETAPIEICDLLVKDILSGKLKVKNRLLIIIGNLIAMNKGVRFNTENLNRLFSGKHQGKDNDEARRAHRLETYVTDFFTSTDKNTTTTKERCHFDLHTAIRASKYEKFAIYPYQNGADWKREYLNLFKDSGIDAILLAHQAAGTFSYFSSHTFQANAFTVELGRVKPFGENDMKSFSEMIHTLKSLISDKYKSSSTFNNEGIVVFKVIDEVCKNSAKNFKLNIDSEIANFTSFLKGYQLTEDGDDSYIFKADNQAIVFPNAKVPIGERVALIVEQVDL